MLINPTKDERPVYEIHDRAKFRRLMELHNKQRVKVIVQVAPRDPVDPTKNGPWWDFLEYSEGVYGPGLRTPTEPVLQMCIAQAGAAFARTVLRSVI